MLKQFTRSIVLVAFVTMLGLPLNSDAEAADLVAIVDLEFVRATDEPAMFMCYGEGEENCGVYATLNVYEATIRKIISGEESRKRMFVLFGRHALGHQNLRGVIATLRKLEATRETDPQYQIQQGKKRELFCFPRREDDSGGFELRKEDEESATCYDSNPQDPQ